MVTFVVIYFTSCGYIFNVRVAALGEHVFRTLLQGTTWCSRDAKWQVNVHEIAGCLPSSRRPGE